MLEQINIKTQAGVDIAAEQKQLLTNLEIKVLSAENDVIQTGNSLLEENNYEAQRSVIFARTRLEVKQAENDVDKIALIMAKEKNSLDALKAKRAQEAVVAGEKAEAAARTAAREAEQAAKKELQVQRQLAQISGEFITDALKLIEIQEGKKARLEAELEANVLIFQTKAKEIELSGQDVRIQQERLALLK